MNQVYSDNFTFPLFYFSQTMSNAIIYALDLSLSARGKFDQATREAWTVFLGAMSRKFTEGLRQGPVP